MAAIEPGPDGTVLRTAEWAKTYDAIPALLAARAKAEEQALADFLAGRIAELPEGERPAATAGDLADDLRRRLRDAAHAVLALPDSTLLIGAAMEALSPGTDPEGHDIVFLGPNGRRTQVDVHTLETQIFSTALVRAWPGVLTAWRDAHRSSPAGYYRIPYAMRAPHRALGGRRHGKSVGLPVKPDGSRESLRLTVTLPPSRAGGTQLEMVLGTKVGATDSDFLDDGRTLRPDVLLRLIAEATGPQLAMIGHAAFALAEEDASGHVFDGRFWYYPTRIAKLLGYSGNEGKSIARVRSLFEAYAATTLRGRWKGADGTEIDVSGSLLYPTQLEATIRTPGRRGRDRRAEWHIRDGLVDLARRHFILIPSALLHCGDEDPRTWASAVRVYEELAYRFRANAAAVGAGEPVRVNLQALANGVNLAPAGRAKRSLQMGQLVGFLDRLQRRGAIRWEASRLADGADGALVVLEDRGIRDRLAEVASRRALLGAGRRRRRTDGTT